MHKSKIFFLMLLANTTVETLVFLHRSSTVQSLVLSVLRRLKLWSSGFLTPFS